MYNAHVLTLHATVLAVPALVTLTSVVHTRAVVAAHDVARAARVARVAHTFACRRVTIEALDLAV